MISISQSFYCTVVHAILRSVLDLPAASSLQHLYISHNTGIIFLPCKRFGSFITDTDDTKQGQTAPIFTFTPHAGGPVQAANSNLDPPIPHRRDRSCAQNNTAGRSSSRVLRKTHDAPADTTDWQRDDQPTFSRHQQPRQPGSHPGKGNIQPPFCAGVTPSSVLQRHRSSRRGIGHQDVWHHRDFLPRCPGGAALGSKVGVEGRT